MPVLTAPSILLDGNLVDDGWVAHDGGCVVDVGVGRPPAAPDVGVAGPPSGPDVVLDRGVLAPGLVDLQCNGAFGHDLSSAGEEEWDEVLARLPEFGVTAVVPTFVTAPLDELGRLVGAAARRREPPGGARVLGVHVEGPYLSPERAGAHRVDLLRAPSHEEIDRLVAAGGGRIAYVTLAPELAGALDAVRQFTRAGVRVSFGHSDASDEQVRAATDAGGTMVTHLYNAQSPLRHREPGVVGAALTDPRLTVGVIADLHHVAPTALRVAFAAAGDRIALVSDATPALGVEPGQHEFAGGLVTVAASGEPPRREDGTLAGSALRLDHAVANVIACGIPPEQALRAATQVPADAVGATRVGRIAVGAAADFTWFNPDWTPQATWVAGDLVHGTAN